MIPALKYTAARLGLMAAAFLILLPVPGPSTLVKALLALLISMPLSWFLLRRWRDQTSVAIARSVERRKERKERLRSALAGEDSSAASGRSGAEPAVKRPEPGATASPGHETPDDRPPSG